jgi:hypothetical protein
MFRTRYLRLKIAILLVALGTFLSYELRNAVWTSQHGTSVITEPINELSLMRNASALKVTPNELKNDLNYFKFELKEKTSNVALSSFRIELSANEPAARVKRDYVILEYTNVFFKPKFCSKKSEEIFNSRIEKCEYQNCFYSCDKSLLKTADALLFHQRDLEVEFEFKHSSDLSQWLKSTTQLPFKTPLAKLSNNEKQIWILWNDEATKVNEAFNKISNLFNWTLSYRTSSEVFRGSYGFMVPRSPRLDDLSTLSDLKKSHYMQDFVKRKNAVLWFVSNCRSQLRIEIALQLSKYYPVYIYGRCDWAQEESRQVWLKDVQNRVTYPYLNLITFKNKECDADSACEIEKLATFKYYLAFENNNCTDYVTEKLWRSLNKNIIPIVLQPNRESYARYLVPFKSIIHLQDFDFDVRALSRYLYKVNSDFELYYSHLKWTSVYSQVYYSTEFLEPHRMCELCKKLNTHRSLVYYTKIADFFNSQCSI